MKHAFRDFRSAALLLLAACGFLVFATAGHAQQIRYVSTSGNDANPCTRVAPCRLLQRGVDVTPIGGELQVLDAGGYGNAVTVTRPITISAVDIAVNTTGPMIINGADAVVIVRGLLFNGRNALARGILINDAAAVHIVDCVIENFTVAGIVLDEADTEIFVTGSVSRGNGGIGLLAVGGNAATLTVDNSRFENNGSEGIYTKGMRSTITHSIASLNGGSGIRAEGFNSLMHVTGTTAAFNKHGYAAETGIIYLHASVAHDNSSAGLLVGENAVARISESIFAGNSIGIQNAGKVLSRGDNTMVDNSGIDVGPNPVETLPVL